MARDTGKDNAVTLFDSNRHLPIDDFSPWSAQRAAAFVAELSQATEAGFREPMLWPVHPDDADRQAAGPHLDLYRGALGVIWAQQHLADLGYGSIRHDYRAVLEALSDSHVRPALSNFDDYRRGLLLGEAGSLVTRLKLAPQPHLSDQLQRLAIANADNPVCEYMWGSPGTLAAALAIVAEPRTVIDTTVAALELQQRLSPTLGCSIWRQALYGFNVCHIGAIHGFAGIAFALLKAFAHLEAAETQRWGQRIRATTKSSAIISDGVANWPQSIDGERPGRNARLVQFCHGAPGMVACLAPLMDGTDRAFDDLMIQGGELVWRAGPLVKGANLCHGTAGNGYAFLKLFTATREEQWLDRARAFAMAGIEQAEAARRQLGDWHYSLWTGDSGLAIYVDACLRAADEIPTMDVF